VLSVDAVQLKYDTVWGELKKAPWLEKGVRTFAAKKITTSFVKSPALQDY